MEPGPESAASSGRLAELMAEPTPEETCSVLARELRSPLSTIEGYLDLLVEGGVGPLTDAQREFLDVVSRNMQRLSSVVGDWYAMTRLEAGRLELSRELVDLEEIADRAVASLRPSIWGKEQHIAVETPAMPVYTLGDPRALLRVVGNLLSNAHKYTPPGGSIRVTIAANDDQAVRLVVADTGIGIRDEDLPVLFRKFFRAHVTEAEPGTGLGLTLTAALVEQMGGTVLVQSAFGKGSTFTLVLPRAEEADLPADSASISGADQWTDGADGAWAASPVPSGLSRR